MMKIHREILKCLPNTRAFIHKKPGACGAESEVNPSIIPDLGSSIDLSIRDPPACKMEVMMSSSPDCCENKVKKCSFQLPDMGLTPSQ